MPLYEYQCDACGCRFEVIRKFSDPPVEQCGSCGGTVRKLPSSPAIQFKGSGWYITDYARKGSSENGGASTKSGGGDGASSSDASTGTKSSDTAKPDKGSSSSTSSSSSPTSSKSD